jgi:diguanylate cyclase (GGDEF)-like protein
VNNDGHVLLVADVCEGEVARFGYLDVDTVIRDSNAALIDLARFAPEAVFLYSCVCRRFSLHREVELETLPFQGLAPTAGFFTFGEFARVEGELQLLNSSQVVIGIREGRSGGPRNKIDVQLRNQPDLQQIRHIKVTGRLFQFIGTLTEKLEEANVALQFQADHDMLTGALNRRALEDHLAAETFRSVRYGHQFAVIMLDIDRFKLFNDRFGHAAGDYVLKSISADLEAHVRSHDTISRYGGEEFVVLLPETSETGALEVAERMRSALESMVLHYDGEKLPTIAGSFGVAAYPDHGADWQAVLKAADAALYRAKELGRNRVVSAG